MHTTVYYFYVFASFVLLLTNLILNQPLTNYPSSQWGYLVLLAVIPTIFGIFLQNWLLKHMSAVILSISILGIPVESNISAFVFYGTVPSMLQIGACVITMIVVWLFLKQKNKQPEILPTTNAGLEDA